MAVEPGGRVSRALLLPLVAASVVAFSVTWHRGLLLATLATITAGGVSTALFAALVGIHLLISPKPASRTTLFVLGWLAAAIGAMFAVAIVSWIR